MRGDDGTPAPDREAFSSYFKSAENAAFLLRLAPYSRLGARMLCGFASDGMRKTNSMRCSKRVQTPT